MIYSVVDYSGDTEKFFSFLKNESHSADPAAENMWSDDWEDKPHTLPYILCNTERFRNASGAFHLILFGDEIIGCSGVYISTFCDNFSLAGSRTWVTPSHRNKSMLKDTVLIEHKKWSISNGIGAVGLCFNEYNKNIIQIFKRARLGERVSRVSIRQPENLFYNGLNEVLFPVTIQHTKQWVIYEKIDPNFEFDWTGIRAE